MSAEGRDNPNRVIPQLGGSKFVIARPPGRGNPPKFGRLLRSARNDSLWPLLSEELPEPSGLNLTPNRINALIICYGLGGTHVRHSSNRRKTIQS